MVFGEGKRKRRNKRIRQYRNTAEGNVTPPRLPLIYLCSIETGVSPCYPPKVSQANRPTPIYKTNQFALWRATKPGARRMIIKTLRTGISRASGREARFEKVFALSYTENAPSRTATADRTTTFQLTTCGTERDGVGQPRQWTLLIYREFEKGEGRERSVKTYHKGLPLFLSRGIYAVASANHPQKEKRARAGNILDRIGSLNFKISNRVNADIRGRRHSSIGGGYLRHCSSRVFLQSFERGKFLEREIRGSWKPPLVVSSTTVGRRSRKLRLRLIRGCLPILFVFTPDNHPSPRLFQKSSAG